MEIQSPKDNVINVKASLDANAGLPREWVKDNTAILLIHGIGNQLPMETIDQFGRGLITEYMKQYGDVFSVEHVTRKKDTDSDEIWFENVVRIKKQGEDAYIDLHEYYWANHTEEKADWKDISDWISGVLRGALKFSKRNIALAEKSGDHSAIIHYKNYNFRYFFFIWSFNILLWSTMSVDFIQKIFPFLRAPLRVLGQLPFAKVARTINNIIGDIVVYNVSDPKSKYYGVRRCILDGAVKAVLSMMEKPDGEGGYEMNYPKVIVAGHSLGSQISYDALNRMNLYINCEQLHIYDKDGNFKNNRNPDVKNPDIAKQLRGFITFGSPLDKITFFLRENIPADQFLRQQLLNDYLVFKQKDWSAVNNTPDNIKYFPLKNMATRRVMETIKWRNYFDQNDYVSGELDYYINLTNVDCKFGSKTWFAFTHSNYWGHSYFYSDIINEFLTADDAGLQ